MTKQAFLSELSSRLSVLGEPLCNEICGDFEEHFTEGAAQGMSEEEICRNLGQPSAIADQFIDEYASNNANGMGFQMPEINIPPINISPVNILPIPPIPPIPPVPPVPPEVPYNSGQQTPYTRISENLYDIDINKSFSEVSDIKVELKNSNLTIQSDPQVSEVTVQIKGRARHDRFIVEADGGVLTVMENAIRYPFQFFQSRKTQLETTICVPARFHGIMEVHVSQGETIVTGVNGRALNLRNSSKNARISDCRFDRFDIHVSAGNLDFTHCQADTIKLHASAGNMKVEDSTGILEAHCSAGHLSIDKHTGESLKAKSSAGDVHIRQCAAEIDVQSSAGNVMVLCDGKILHNVHARSSAGDVKLKAEEASYIDLSCSAGNVKVNVNKLHGDAHLQSSAGNVLMEAYEIGGNIDVKASMGGIHLRLPEKVNCRIEANSRMGAVRQHINGNAQSPYVLRATSSMGTVVLEPIGDGNRS